MTGRTDRGGLDVLVCDWDARPRGAPGIPQIATAILDVSRDGERALAVSFDLSASREVEAFVAAERRCCASLSWTLETSGAALRLTIAAEREQLDVLEQLFTAVT